MTVTGKKALTDQQAASVVVCHEEPVLGTRFPKKVCATRQASAERRREDQEVAREFQKSVIVGAQPQ